MFYDDKENQNDSENILNVAQPEIPSLQSIMHTPCGMKVREVVTSPWTPDSPVEGALNADVTDSTASDNTPKGRPPRAPIPRKPVMVYRDNPTPRLPAPVVGIEGVAAVPRVTVQEAPLIKAHGPIVPQISVESPEDSGEKSREEDGPSTSTPVHKLDGDTPDGAGLP